MKLRLETSGSHHSAPCTEGGSERERQREITLYENTGLSDKLRPHVLVAIAEFDRLGDSYTILGYLGRTEALVDYSIAALWSKSDLHCIG